MFARAGSQFGFSLALVFAPKQFQHQNRLSDDSKVELLWCALCYVCASGKPIWLLARARFRAKTISTSEFVFLTIPKSNCFGARFAMFARAGNQFGFSLALVFVPDEKVTASGLV